MKILIGCEYSGIVSQAFREKGHIVWSCDLLPTVGDPNWHYTDNVLNHLNDGFDMGIFFPPCTYLSVSGLHWNKRRPERAKLTEDAIEFVQTLWDAPIDRIAIENPIGVLSTRIRRPDQIIQPYMFGHSASKATCLWLKNLPKLSPTKMVEPTRIVGGLPRWANQTDSGQNRLGPSPDRWKARSITYEGIAKAMADTWS